MAGEMVFLSNVHPLSRPQSAPPCLQTEGGSISQGLQGGSLGVIRRLFLRGLKTQIVLNCPKKGERS